LIMLGMAILELLLAWGLVAIICAVLVVTGTMVAMPGYIATFGLAVAAKLARPLVT